VNVAQEKAETIRVFLIVASWQRFSELISPASGVSKTKEKARYFSGCAEVNKFS